MAGGGHPVGLKDTEVPRPGMGSPTLPQFSTHSPQTELCEIQTLVPLKTAAHGCFCRTEQPSRKAPAPTLRPFLLGSEAR